MFTLSSYAFQDGQVIPVKYARTGVYRGENISVPLAWAGVPEGTKSFALVCVDRSPIAGNWIHWAAVNIPESVSSVPEGAPLSALGATDLVNTYGNARYDGPQPPKGTGPHEYEFTVFALNVETVEISKQPQADEFERAVKPFTIESANLTGTFENRI